MNGRSHSARALTLLALASVLATACQQDDPTAPSTGQPLATTGQSQAVLAAGNPNGAGGQRPAFYDDELFTVNMKELSASAAASLIAHNASINEIYATNDLDDPQDFFSVIDAIPGDGFNPLWRQILIVFNPGFTPHQFTSDDEVEAAAAGPNPEITLIETDEIYRCSVVSKP
jgi:hypothetical protein